MSLEWSQLQANNPRQPASVYHLAHQDAAHKDVPAPRGGHSATLVGTDAVWLFGGYGGFGYSRKEMDDLYRLDIRSMSWQLVQPKVRSTVRVGYRFGLRGRVSVRRVPWQWVYTKARYRVRARSGRESELQWSHKLK